MKALVSWLKDFVDINVTIDELQRKMVAIGLEIESVEYLGKDISNVFVGQIKSIVKHANANKLQICQVEVGAGNILQIVTGAANIAVGDKVPVAVDGAILPNGKTINNAVLLGEQSNGMLCSGAELKINNDIYPNAEVNGILILNQTEKIGADIVDVIGLNDYIIDVNVTSNRPDCNSIYGLAREISVALGANCKKLHSSYNFEGVDDISSYVNVKVEAPKICPNYLMKVVKDVKIQRSPLWMTRRLSLMGHSCINNIVDITNYILVELGQPLHAFDYNDINDKTIVVRRARDNEQLTTFDNKTYTLDSNMLVIADKQRAVGLAGIMGGVNSGIKADTSIVAFEAAKFARESIRKTSKKLGLRSDASARFEKGVDFYTTQLALYKVLHMIQLLNCGTIVGGLIDISVEKEQVKTIRFKYSNIIRRLGIDIPRDVSQKILNSLNIVTTFDGEDIICDIPLYREDIERDADISEEIIRVYGYDNITSTLLQHASITQGGRPKSRVDVDKIKSSLCAAGFSEICTYSFGGSALYAKLNQKVVNQIKVKNPLGEELSLMRTTLVGNMLSVLATNLNRKNPSAKLYEYGKVYIADKLPLTQLPNEINMLSIGGYQTDFYTIKAALNNLAKLFNVKFNYKTNTANYLHPGISADIYIEDKYLGSFGKVHPSVARNFDIIDDVFVGEINVDCLLQSQHNLPAFINIPKHPSVNRDLAVVVNQDIQVGEMMEAVKLACNLCIDIALLDVYTGSQIEKGLKSVALTFTFQSGDKTLTDKEIEGQVALALNVLSNNFEAKLR